MTESDRRLAALVLRIRIALALVVLGLVGIAQQARLGPGDVAVRGLVVGLGLAAAAGIQQVAGRRDRQVGVALGIGAEFFTFAIAVALFERFVPLVPALLIWPIVAAAFFIRQAHVLALAALATAMVLEIAVLRNNPPIADLVATAGWGALYLSLGVLASAAAATLRRAQRHAASAYASVATVSTATTYAELAEIVFAYLERILDLPTDAPAAFLFDTGDGRLSAIDAENLDPESRARFRLDPDAATALAALVPAAGWIDRAALEPAVVPAAFRRGAAFLAPLRDDARTVGFVIAARRRRRRLSPETAAALGRLTTQAAIAAIRIRGAGVVETQRQAIAILIEGHDASGSGSEIAAWLGRTVRDLVPSDGIAILEDAAADAHLGGDASAVVDAFPAASGPPVRAVYAVGLQTEHLAAEVVVLVNEGRRRGVAVIIPDAASEQRLALPPFLRRGACVLIPLRGQPTYLLVQRRRRDSFTTGDLQLLVLLCDQAATLLTRAPAIVTDPAGWAAPPVERRLAAVAAHVRDVPGDARAQEDRGRIVDALRLAIEGNQPQLAGSGERVAAVATLLAARLGITAEEVDAVYVASLLRDVGELSIERRILDAPGHLTPEQREIVRRHPLLGEAILATLPFLSGAAAIVRAHHERWDGSGYPDQLRGAEIPTGARIVAVADAFVAMTSPRRYRAALRASEAMAAIIRTRGQIFDPAVVDALAALGESGLVPSGS